MTSLVSCKKEVPELKILQSLAFLTVVLQSALTYTINQPNMVPEQAITMEMFFNFAKSSAPAVKPEINLPSFSFPVPNRMKKQ